VLGVIHTRLLKNGNPQNQTCVRKRVKTLLFFLLPPASPTQQALTENDIIGTSNRGGISEIGMFKENVI